MEDFNAFKDYTISESKTGKRVPIIDGVQLHSVYNPEKEAESFIDQHSNMIKNNKLVLCLGLGFGYHIQSLMQNMSELYGNIYKIVIIDPISQVYHDCKKYELLPTQNVTVYHGNKVSELYHNRELVDFLLKKPGVISHAPSFNLHKDYFTQFLTYSAPEKIIDLSTHITSSNMCKYLASYNSESTLNELLFNGLERPNGVLENEDFILLAYKHLTKTKEVNKQGLKRE